MFFYYEEHEEIIKALLLIFVPLRVLRGLIFPVNPVKKVSLKNLRCIHLIAILLFIFMAGCAAYKTQPDISEKTALYRVSLSEFPVFSDDMGYDELEYSICNSISYLKKVSPLKKFKFGNDFFSTAHMIKSLEHFKNYIQTKPSKQDLNQFVRSNYLIYKSIGGSKHGQVLFTGYYEPILQGSLRKSNEYSFPIYARPDDLITVDLSLFSSRFKGEKIIGRYFNHAFVPYHERNEIDYEDSLKEKTEIIAWVNDPVDLFFLQIQGSGKICLDNGQTINVHYHATNGRPYRSIGKLLIENEKIPRSQMSMQKIRSYLNDNPEELKTILNYNPSYIFFKIEKEGPLGCLNVKLTPGRSIALDRRISPEGALAFIETEKPLINGSGQIHVWTKFKRFVLNHDTGGAIKGPGRADLFYGNGLNAEIAAGHMKHFGELYFLVLKPEISRVVESKNARAVK
ncbi:MAG: MltA domain-containing protein [Deltaproteobacteria bacterium]|nr:MltA domain-containing protein [Deltaproteobacteria bacterium]MBW2660431.1 MltA domain-containing protein [Deltaproteobacteria bacterium]